ncbi:MAG: hypothetical protein ABIZ64_07355 [Casimicrobium sp.]
MASGEFEPTEIAQWNALSIPRMGGALDVWGYGAWANAGEFWQSIDGERFFHSTAGSYIYYMQTKALPGNASAVGKFFLQHKTGFKYDITTGGTAAGVRRMTAGTKAVITTFMDVFIGTVALVGGPVGWGIMGMNAIVLGGKVVRNYTVYEDALVAILSSRKQMRDKMPVFYRTVLWELYFGVVEQKLMSKSKDLLADAIPGPKVAGKLVGVLLGALGEDKFQQRLTALDELFTDVLEKVSKFAMDANQPIGAKKIVLSDDQVRQLANLHVKRILATTNIVMPAAAEMEEIIREATRQWTMHSAYKKMSAAIKALA